MEELWKKKGMRRCRIGPVKVAIDKSFPLQGSAEAAWAVLSDIEATASCMPGAKITERVDETHYKGTVAVKVGPASLSFRGEIEVANKDVAAKTVRLLAKGMDSTGGSSASMDLTASVEAGEGGSSVLKGVCESSVSGKVAAFGGRLMNSVADQILDQFAANFAARVAAVPAAPPAASQDDPPAAKPASPQMPAEVPHQELNGLALAWGVFKSWLRGIFGGK
jgi:carbon monoxide dehydrogenase subunit G